MYFNKIEKDIVNQLHPSLTKWRILATQLLRMTLVSSFDNSIYSPLHMFKDQCHCIVTLSTYHRPWHSLSIQLNWFIFLF